MGNPGLTREEVQDAFDAIAAHKTQQAAADALGISRGALQNRLNAPKRGLLGTEPTLPGYYISKETAVYDKNGDLAREFIQQKPERGGPFEVPDGHHVKGVSALVDAHGNTIQQWIKTKEERDHTDVVAAVKEAISEYEGTARIYPPPSESDPNTFTVIPLVDWHIGLMAWAAECGENYDLTIARNVILEAMAKVIHHSPPSAKCVILGLGDMLHFDGFEAVTSRSGNFLDADGRYPKVLKTAVGMIRSTIDMALQKFTQVDVRLLPGNHDDRATVALNLGFDLLYENDERVDFDDSPARFWWYRQGNVFLGATHGDQTKMKDLPLVMAHDRPQDWAESTYRRIYTGHRHNESAVEEGGVLVTCMRSPVAKDAYHSFKKYRSGRSVYTDTYDVSGKVAASLKINI